jgi:hypothetical protein
LRKRQYLRVCKSQEIIFSIPSLEILNFEVDGLSDEGHSVLVFEECDLGFLTFGVIELEDVDYKDLGLRGQRGGDPFSQPMLAVRADSVVA